MALQQEKSSREFGLFSKSSYESDLLEKLYGELVIKDAELRKLEERINTLGIDRIDSVEDFERFDQKNSSYYVAADQHVTYIKDSLLRERMRTIVGASQARYNSQVSVYKKLIDILNSRAIVLEDMHLVLKIIKTLPMIEKYQKENKLSTNPIEQVTKEMNKIIQQIDSATRQ